MLRAISSANRVHGRTVTIAEVVAQLTPDEVPEVRHRHRRDLSTAVSMTALHLCRAGLAFSPGFDRQRRVYGAVGVLAQSDPLPAPPRARRQVVLDLVRAAVDRLGRGVRIQDVAEQADLDVPEIRLDRGLLATDLSSLTRRGNLLVIGRVSGRRSGGTHVLLPSDYPLERYSAADLATWPQRVLAAFEGVWEEHMAAAESEGRLPEPVLAREVFDRMADAPARDPELTTPARLVTVLRTLSRGRDAPLRQVAAGGYGRAWCPQEAKTEQYELLFRSDTQRVTEALERACRGACRPFASQQEVADEVERDPALLLCGGQGVARALESAARSTVGDRGGGTRQRRRQVISCVGSLEGTTYYSRSDRLAAAQVHMELLRATARLDALHAEEQLEQLRQSKLRCVAQARAAGMLSELATVAELIRNCVADPAADVEARTSAESTMQRVSALQNLLSGWTRFALEGVPEPVPSMPAWMPEELYEAVWRLAPGLLEGKTPRDIFKLFGARIRCVPNPHFVRKAHADRVAAVQFLFDRADALILLAVEWGGSECRQQAITAKHELGIHRDPLPVIAALPSLALEERLVAVACLAFLWSEEAREVLRDLALHDPEPGVRQAALWAYGFSGGADAVALVRRRALEEPNTFARRFALSAAEAIALDDRGWWPI